VGSDLSNRYWSHSGGRLLVDHLRAVGEGARRTSSLAMAEVAGLFHDLGKVNPNFQRKINPSAQFQSTTLKSNYSGHAYLSAVAWLAFCARNRDLIQDLIGREDVASVLAVAAIVAHHHGNLPDLKSVDGFIFHSDHFDSMVEF
jgi:CRISPR-associated endonuclease/helicase Cas3